MLRDPTHNRISEWMRRQARAAAIARRPRPRDTLATLMLGTLAMGVGLVTLAATLAGIAGVHRPLWNEPHEVMTEATPRHSTLEWDPEQGKMIRSPALIVAATIWVPSAYCFSVSMLGSAFGGAGIALGMRRRRVSVLSAVGLLFCLLVPLVGMTYLLVMNLLYFVMNLLY